MTTPETPTRLTRRTTISDLEIQQARREGDALAQRCAELTDRAEEAIARARAVLSATSRTGGRR